MFKPINYNNIGNKSQTEFELHKCLYGKKIF